LRELHLKAAGLGTDSPDSARDGLSPPRYPYA